MKSFWRLLGVAAAVHITLGSGTAAAQRVMVRNAPAGTAVEVIVNGAAPVNGTIDESGSVTIPFVVPEKDGKAEMDANIFVDICDKRRRVLIVDRSRSAAPVAEGCDRREISGLYWVRRVNTIVIDLAPANPALLLVTGNYTPPKPSAPETDEEESKPHAPLPRGFMLFAGAGTLKLRDFGVLQCGTASPCSANSNVASYSFGVDYWFTPHFAIEASYLKPTEFKASGGNTYTFETKMPTDIWTVVGKAGAQAGAVRLYGQGGLNYHQTTLKTRETISPLTQNFEVQTDGWNYTYGGGAEVWIRKKLAIYGELNIAKIKGNDKAGGEATIDDRATALIVGVRLHAGG